MMAHVKPEGDLYISADGHLTRQNACRMNLSVHSLYIGISRSLVHFSQLCNTIYAKLGSLNQFFKEKVYVHFPMCLHNTKCNKFPILKGPPDKQYKTKVFRMLKYSIFIVQYKTKINFRKSRNIFFWSRVEVPRKSDKNKSVPFSVSKFRHDMEIHFPFIQDKSLTAGGEFIWRNLMKFFSGSVRLEWLTLSRCNETSGACSLSQTSNRSPNIPWKILHIPFCTTENPCQTAHTYVWQDSTVHHAVAMSNNRFPMYFVN